MWRSSATANRSVCSRAVRRAGSHVPLAIIDDCLPGSMVELKIAAPEGLATKVMIDVGFVEFE